MPTPSLIAIIYGWLEHYTQYMQILPKKKVEAKVANKNRKSVKPEEPLDLVAEMLRQQRPLLLPGICIVSKMILLIPLLLHGIYICHGCFCVSCKIDALMGMAWFSMISEYKAIAPYDRILKRKIAISAACKHQCFKQTTTQGYSSLIYK